MDTNNTLNLCIINLANVAHKLMIDNEMVIVLTPNQTHDQKHYSEIEEEDIILSKEDIMSDEDAANFLISWAVAQYFMKDVSSSQ